jgi:hypothetical protein
MPTKFDDYLREIEEKIKAEGPEAVACWEAFNTHFAMAHEVRELRKERHLTQSNSPPPPASARQRFRALSVVRPTPPQVPSLPCSRRWKPA